MSKFEKGSIGYFLELAKKDGFDNIKDWNEWRKKNGKMPDATNIFRKDREKVANNTKLDDKKEYRDYLARKKGYKNHSEYKKNKRWDDGENIPMSENENCSSYLGDIGENYSIPILTEIFGCIEKIMPYGNTGYDIIVKGGHKIDVKSPVLNKTSNFWQFDIGYNKIADYYLLIALDNRENLCIMRVWLIHRDDIIRGRELWKRYQLYITNKPRYLWQFEKYEWTDKLECIRHI